MHLGSKSTNTKKEKKDSKHNSTKKSNKKNLFPVINDRYNNNNFNSDYHIENMPVMVPNFFYNKYYQDNNADNNRYDNNNLSNKDNNLIDENQSAFFYMNRLEEKIRRLENINDIFLNIMREDARINKGNIYKNYSHNDLSKGPYPYLSIDKNGNKNLLYLNQDSINNNEIISGKYKENYLYFIDEFCLNIKLLNDILVLWSTILYLLPIMPKYNSIQEKNRISYLLNEEKLKYLKKDSQPYFYYDFNRSNKSYIPQKINSVQYFNKKIDYKKFNSTDNINLEIKPEKKSKGKSSKNITTKSNKSKKSNNKNINNDDIKNEINKMNDDLNKRLSKIEDLQKSQKKDIDYLMGKSKGNNKSTKSSKKEENKKEEEKKNNDNNNEESDDEEDEDDEED